MPIEGVCFLKIPHINPLKIAELPQRQNNHAHDNSVIPKCPKTVFRKVANKGLDGYHRHQKRDDVAHSKQGDFLGAKRNTAVLHVVQQ